MDAVMDAMRLMAEKLGTTVETLVPHYVQYVWACGLVGVIIGALLLFAGVPACFWVAAWGARGLADPQITDEEPRVAAVVTGILLGIVGIVGGLVAIGCSLPALLAPEGYAVAQILKSML